MNSITASLIILIKAYRKLVSPFLPSVCRFHPSCSAYALEALKQHGLIKGLGMIIRRLGRCHPWNPGGYDPVTKSLMIQKLKSLLPLKIVFKSHSFCPPDGGVKGWGKKGN